MLKKFIKPADVILAAVLLALGLCGLFLLRSSANADARVSVRVENVEMYSCGLNETKEFTVKTDYGYNIVCVENGQVWVREADCPNKDCMDFGKIGSAGQVIICAPHKLLVEIVNGSGGPDAFVY